MRPARRGEHLPQQGRQLGRVESGQPVVRARDLGETLGRDPLPPALTTIVICGLARRLTSLAAPPRVVNPTTGPPITG